MEKEKIQEILDTAKKQFLAREEPLLVSDANERSITHKFAEYLQTIVRADWNVDCEYNRSGNNPKKIEEIERIVGERTTTSETKTRTVCPDIIVHKRGVDGPNLLVIEAKKDATPQEHQEDVKKLKLIRKQYNYDFSVFINFKTKTREIEWSFV
ncbi:MAG: hypothetical protein HYT94_03705 [Parcubacteria group bacterium]|nr:hypothetical protein [Parcubacteria group bacterium]